MQRSILKDSSGINYNNRLHIPIFLSNEMEQNGGGDILINISSTSYCKSSFNTVDQYK